MIFQEQYMFIHDAILEQVTCGDTQISAGQLHSAVQNLTKIDQLTFKTGLQTQFDVSKHVHPIKNMHKWQFTS